MFWIQVADYYNILPASNFLSYPHYQMKKKYIIFKLYY